MNVVVDNLLTNCRLDGKGDLLLLLHGWGDSIKGVDSLHAELVKHYQVLSPDLPGFGGTQPPPEAWDLDNYAMFLRDLLAKLDLPQPYAIIGHSNGGAIAIRSFSLGLIKPKKMVLIASAGIRTNGGKRRGIVKVIAKVGKVVTFWLPESRRNKLKKILYGTTGSDIMVAPGLEETFKQTVRQDVQADASNISCPTLIINATNDRAIPLRDGERFHELIKDSKFEVIHGGGHFFHQEKSSKVNALIEGFLK